MVCAVRALRTRGDSGLEIFDGVVQVVVGDEQQDGVEDDERGAVLDVEEGDQLGDEEQRAQDNGEQGFLVGQQQAQQAGDDLEDVAAVGEGQDAQGSFRVGAGAVPLAGQEIGESQVAQAQKDLDGAGDAQMLGSASRGKIPPDGSNVWLQSVIFTR